MIRKILMAAMLISLVPQGAKAQDAAAISSARETAKSGIADYYAGHHEAAHDKLSRAFEVVRVPTLALFNARALAKMGRLVEASEFYLTAMRLKSGEGDIETQNQARTNAKLERIELLKRIPRLRIIIVGAAAEKVTVQANDTQVLPSLFATGWMVNPGAIRVTGVLGEQRVETTERFAEGEDKAVTLTFEATALATPAPLVAPPTVQAGTPSDRVTDKPPSSYRTAAWISAGMGAFGLAFGAATGLWAISEKRELDSGKYCIDTKCDGAQVGDTVDRYNLLRGLSTSGFIIAAVGATAGVVLYLNEPKTMAATARPRMTPWLGVGTLGLKGAF